MKCCSVVSVVTLTLLVINTSSSIYREQQKTPVTSDECHQLATVQRSCVYNTWQSKPVIKPDIGRESRFLLTPFALTPSLGGSPWNIVIRFDVEKPEWWLYQMV